MDKVSTTIIVFFDEPFWAGVFELVSGDRLSACKVTFGPMPKSYELYSFILKNYYRLKFSPYVSTDACISKKNPKSIQKDIHRQLTNNGVGTKSQQALKMQHEQSKEHKRAVNKKRSEEYKQHQFELKQKKKKEKHKGR